jgi:hypothetical protein
MNKLIKPILCILFLTAFGYTGFGQEHIRVRVRRGAPINRVIPMYPRAVPLYRVNRPNPGMRVERVKENYIAQQLKLTPEESKAFWPLYRQYVEDQTAVRILKRQNNSDNSPGGTDQINKELDYEQQLVEIRKRYADEFLKILPPQKLSLLYKSERQFNDEMLNILKERTVRQGN